MKSLLRVMDQVMRPVVEGMRLDGVRYTGFLYAGLMIKPDGSLKVLEFNCRFGDPETQPILFRLRSDLLALIEAALDGKLGKTKAEWDPRPTVGVVMAAAGYPGEVPQGRPDQRPADCSLQPPPRSFTPAPASTRKTKS